jgi:hypothetical protein
MHARRTLVLGRLSVLVVATSLGCDEAARPTNQVQLGGQGGAAGAGHTGGASGSSSAGSSGSDVPMAGANGSSGAGSGGDTGVHASSGTGGDAAGSGSGTEGSPGGSGAGTGGSSDAGTSGSTEPPSDYDPADHCAPGEYVDMLTLDNEVLGGAFFLKQCAGDNRNAAMAAGVGDNGGLFMTVDSIELPEAMSAGEPYAMSWEFDLHGDNEFTYELWGANGVCGTGGPVELLHSEPLHLEPTVLCSEVVPSASYTHLLVVVRMVTDPGSGGYGYEGMTICPSGSCP